MRKATVIFLKLAFIAVKAIVSVSTVDFLIYLLDYPEHKSRLILCMIGMALIILDLLLTYNVCNFNNSMRYTKLIVSLDWIFLISGIAVAYVLGSNLSNDNKEKLFIIGVIVFSVAAILRAVFHVLSYKKLKEVYEETEAKAFFPDLFDVIIVFLLMQGVSAAVLGLANVTSKVLTNIL